MLRTQSTRLCVRVLLLYCKGFVMDCWMIFGSFLDDFWTILASKTCWRGWAKLREAEGTNPMFVFRSISQGFGISNLRLQTLCSFSVRFLTKYSRNHMEKEHRVCNLRLRTRNTRELVRKTNIGFGTSDCLCTENV